MNPILNQGGTLVVPKEADAYQEAARKWRKELLHLPIIGLEETLKYMTVRGNIRFKETVGAIALGAQFQPYKQNMSSEKDLTLNLRTLETFMGAVVLDFDPNSVAQKVIGEKAATKGIAMKQAEIAKDVLVELAKDLSEHLNEVIWTAKRNAEGTTSADLFDGLDTITIAEIAAGKISVAAKNYIKLTEVITEANCYDVLKKALRKSSPLLRKEKNLFLYCDPVYREMYDDAYLATHKGVSYYTNYEQAKLEGTKIQWADMSNKSGSKFLHLSTKGNMLIGCDQMSDMESINVEKYKSFVLTFEATMFFGAQFESIDKRRLFVIELADAQPEVAKATPAAPAAPEAGE